MPTFRYRGPDDTEDRTWSPAPRPEGITGSFTRPGGQTTLGFALPTPRLTFGVGGPAGRAMVLPAEGMGEPGVPDTLGAMFANQRRQMDLQNQQQDIATGRNSQWSAFTAAGGEHMGRRRGGTGCGGIGRGGTSCGGRGCGGVPGHRRAGNNYCVFGVT